MYSIIAYISALNYIIIVLLPTHIHVEHELLVFIYVCMHVCVDCIYKGTRDSTFRKFKSEKALCYMLYSLGVLHLGHAEQVMYGDNDHAP